ncbi:MAG: 1-(5-phosphoribosyl)-5-[(5-phosphoribosylamino)methylideneamino]imidazole-4-carboxamide isomerase [Acidobacteriota bacterium]|nr:1-(5-phosphoribosyl)-5-[(5-phosphoribosylamino)methylideneamino]imidazole-4-carboxamide isomerase [Acidobacteriota bacterium]
MEIIPAIDLIDGKCVRLRQGDFAQKTIYDENPLNQAQAFENAGLKRLHIVDLDGAKNGQIVNLKVLETIARRTNLTIDFGGGIKTDADIQSVFDAGAKWASIGSIAVKDAAKFFAWIEKYGGERILLGADVNGEKLAINGWQTATEIEIIPFLKEYFAKGVTQVFVTDIAKDGLLQGTSNALYAKIRREIPDLKLIASGGVSVIEDLHELEKIGCAGAIVGKAFYEGKIKLEEFRTKEI